MKSRKDQVQAYFFVVGRLAAAVTHGRPDVVQAPNRRLNTGTVLGIMLAALLMAVFGIYGLFVPGGDNSWRQPGTIVMNKTTGARYVYLDGQLRPVLNYSSARLVGGKSGTGAVVSVSQNSLGDTPVGQPIGIVGAPDALPDAGKLKGGPWTVCVQPDATGTPPGPKVTLLLGPRAGRVLADRQALLVSTSDGTSFLLWQGKRHRVAGRAVLQTLGYGDVVPVAVTTAWLNTIPQAQDISVPVTPGIGEPGPRIDGRPSVVGQVYEVRNPAISSAQLYLVRQDGIAPLSRTTAALVLAAPSTRGAYPGEPVAPIQVGPAALSGVAASSGLDLVAGLPPEPPEVVTPTRDSLACTRLIPSATGEMGVVAELLPSASVTAQAVPVAQHVAGSTADLVSIPAGGGVLARETPAPGAPSGTVYLVTEVGIRYPLADAEVMGALGYTESSVIRVPAELLALLPAGPLLSVAGALQGQAPRP
ncbi:type VII secretion protein EccB [Amycolatopsis sp. EV170708-02-1]|uniref:type VII secretion protein EccB n=1 Tax=Amycolatopsis sp. EV170708-02-1 TaxID=2919322 RepID=UPI001F0B74F9|nr:type VII secretion protein EccB [Amycolatopsis sp. EV170708-02-1]UMP06953.1 type VII secretion protein EccB [Amycolatopsis sp. EV170708-02-1]